MGTGDDLVLVAVEPGKRRLRGGERLRFAVRAAELGDLVARGRIAVGERRIEVADPEQVEDRRLNGVLQSLGAAVPPPSLAAGFRATPRSLAHEYLSRLEDRKLVRVRRWRDRGGRTHHDILYVDVAARREVLRRLDRRDGADEDGSLVLAALVRSVGLDRVAYPGLRGTAARRRLAARTEAAGALAAVGDAVRAAGRRNAAAEAGSVDLFTGRLFGELTAIYGRFGSAGHGFGYDGGDWSTGETGGGHHGGEHHGGGEGHGGW
jgi:hypothetical protein